jgi:hypothetical protein
MEIEGLSVRIDAAYVRHGIADGRSSREVTTRIVARSGTRTERTDEAVLVLPAGCGFLSAGLSLQAHEAVPIVIGCPP